jgi:predicted transcriptional regulator
MKPLNNNTQRRAKQQQKGWLSISDAARYLGVSRNTMRKYLPEITGTVRISDRLTRIPVTGLREWLTEFQQEATQ